ncbi:MAG: EF-P lysine aminoacylase EpmA [Polyangiaceae bacterium]|jgi:lysyl-tRNA synthetase class 2
MKHLRERAAVLGEVRRFFDARDFLEVQTPILVPSPGSDLHLDAFEVQGGDRGQPRWLITSPEYQMKRLLARGWPRIYQIGSSFRRGEVGAHHNPEFTMLEWYRAHAGMADVMRDTEQLVARVTGGTIRAGGHTVDVTPPFVRVTLCEAFARFARWSPEETLDAAANDETRYFRALIEQVEPGLERLGQAAFLVDFPATQASLARTKPDDPRLAERFELYVAGLELCNGFGELVDPVEQRRRLLEDQSARKEAGRPVYPIDERFVADLARVPPSGGNALGLDRLVALSCGLTEIAPVLAFTADEV